MLHRYSKARTRPCGLALDRAILQPLVRVLD